MPTTFDNYKNLTADEANALHNIRSNFYVISGPTNNAYWNIVAFDGNQGVCKAETTGVIVYFEVVRDNRYKEKTRIRFISYTQVEGFGLSAWGEHSRSFEGFTYTEALRRAAEHFA